MDQTRRHPRTGQGYRANVSRSAAQHGQRPGTATYPGQPKPISRPLTPDMLRRVENDPVFTVVSLDGAWWIDPYSAQAVRIGPQGRASTARQHLTETASWRTAEVLPLVQLETERWRVDLDRLLPTEPRLRLFLRDNRGWMNPFSGEPVPGVDRPDGKIAPRTVWQMASHLASCPHARAGRMLDMAALSARARAGMPSETPVTPPEVPVARPAHAYNEDMAKAQSVQQHMLSDLPKPPGYELAVHLSPHAGVAGDFYEVSTLRDGRIFIALGDVSGHGMQAALVVATALKTLRFVARSTNDLTELVCRFNDEIKPDLVPGQFITLFAAVLNPSSRDFSCLRAGHQPAVLVNLAREDSVRRLGRAGMAIGIASGSAFSSTLRPMALRLEPGDVLVQSTDGALEAMDGKNVEFGLARYLASILRRYDTSAQELVDGIADDVHLWARGAVGDDLSVLALAVLPGEDPSGPQRTLE